MGFGIYFIFNNSLIMIALVLFTKFPNVERKEDEITGNWEIHKELFKKQNSNIIFYWDICICWYRTGCFILDIKILIYLS